MRVRLQFGCAKLFICLRLIVCLVFWMLLPCVAGAIENAKAETVSRLRADVEYLCSPALQGRDTPGAAGDSTAGWIADSFAQIGMETAPDTRSFLYNFPVISSYLDTATTTITLEAPGQNREILWGSQFFVFPQGGASFADTLEVAICGYGIVSSSLGRDDYSEAARGRAAVVLAGAGNLPPEKVGSLAMAPFKAAAARRSGAAMLVVLYPSVSAEQWPPPELMGKREGVMKPVFDLPDPEPSFPIVYMDSRVFDEMTGGIKISEVLKPESFKPYADTTLRIALHQRFRDLDRRSCSNIIGRVEGKTGQYILVGAHYDHLGNANKGYFPGADDNASGVAGLLEICRRWSLRPQPERGLIAVAFGCEEDGLLGSKWLASHLPVAKDSIVTMLNLDMIGRDGFSNMREVGKPGAVPDTGFAAAYYSAAAPMLRDPIHAAADVSELRTEIRPVNSFGHFGDASAFHAAGIPTLHIFSGFHGDYHTPDDTVDKLDFSKMARIVNLVDQILLNLSNNPCDILFDPKIRVEESPVAH